MSIINSKCPILDYTEEYKSIMQFNKNKTASIHQWYPFVEGYSKEFIRSILDELEYTPLSVLEPFSGSGTTPVEMQSYGIQCYSFEVSPFMHLLSTVKMCKDYLYANFVEYILLMKELLNRVPHNIRDIEPIPFGRTIVEDSQLGKWNFNNEIMDGILDIKYVIRQVPEQKYQSLYRIALASILLEVSNVFRNGKCLSYKKNWQTKNVLTRNDVHLVFFNKLNDTFLDDIKKIDLDVDNRVDNSKFCFYGDVRENIKLIPDNSIDLIITSPPYLNSRDYTDIYMLELKVLDLVHSHEDLQELRKRTLRSHVQVKHGALEVLDIPLLKETISLLEQNRELFWNRDLLNMIKGYFIDIDLLFMNFHLKMKRGKKIFFNVANSAYYGIEIPVDEIVAHIAEKRGFQINEIRVARNLKASSQQSDSIKSLRESVTVMTSI